MQFPPAVRKWLLAGHVASSVGWMGALAVFLAHAAVSLGSQDAQVVRAAALAMDVSAWFVILPLCLATLLTGILQALGTAWGLLRHYWIVFKLALTLIATIVLLLKLGPISQLAVASMETAFSAGDLVGLRTSLRLHAAGGIVVLLAALLLAVFKPPGLTRWTREWVAPTPRWVKMSAALLATLLLLVALMVAGGGHGPSAHLH